MTTGLGEVDTLVRKLDLESDLDEVRRGAARLILRELEARRDPLASWEKMHLEMAIALLPTVWLRLSLTHLRMALDPPESNVQEQIEREHGDQFDSITRSQLIARLIRVNESSQ